MCPPEWCPPLLDSYGTGGTVSRANGYVTHVFRSSGSFSLIHGATLEISSLLLVGGGGGCAYGTYHGGGGGAGGLVLASSRTARAGETYEVVVGMGGSGAGSMAGRPSNGGDTSAFGLKAIGGGHGGGYDSGASGSGYYGADGGSAGGNMAYHTASPASSTQDKYESMTGVEGYGHAGGVGNHAPKYSAGGGGAPVPRVRMAVRSEARAVKALTCPQSSAAVSVTMAGLRVAVVGLRRTAVAPRRRQAARAVAGGVQRMRMAAGRDGLARMARMVPAEAAARPSVGQAVYKAQRVAPALSSSATHVPLPVALQLRSLLTQSLWT